MSLSTHQSRRGYHPCNFELYLKLKSLHKQYWLTLRDFHRWHRWFRKQPQNRTGNEPIFCQAFVEKRPWRKRRFRHGEEHFKIYPATIVDHDVVELYHKARRPSELPVEAFDAETVQRIENLFAKVSQSNMEATKV